MKWQEIAEALEASGVNLGWLALGRMMDQAEEDSGRWPDWEDQAPAWVLRALGWEAPDGSGEMAQ